jgi:hypothetical protein
VGKMNRFQFWWHFRILKNFGVTSNRDKRMLQLIKVFSPSYVKWFLQGNVMAVTYMNGSIELFYAYWSILP